MMVVRSRLEDVVRDVRHGARGLRRAPLFTLTAVGTLALAIGASTAIFALADALLFRTLPVPAAHELVTLRQRGRGGDILPFSSPAAEHLALERGALAGLAAFRPAPGSLVQIRGETEVALTQAVSGNYHEVLGVRAVLGRTLLDSDRGPVAVISHRYWQRRFAGDPAALGQAVTIGERAYTIVGVTPAAFFGTEVGRHVDVSTPLAEYPSTMPPDARWLYLIGRLAPGVSQHQALASLRVRWASLASAGLLPPRPVVSLEIDGGAQGLNALSKEFSSPLRVLLAAAGVVFLAACANLAALLTARSSARRHEMAVRRSLGASRWRIVRQLLTESALLSAAAGATGLALAHWLTSALFLMMSRGRETIAIDVAPAWPAFAFALAATAAAAVLFGLVPAIDVSATAATGVRGGTSRSRTPWSRAIMAGQLALVLLLLAAAGLFSRSLQNLLEVDAGFRPDQVLSVGVAGGAGQSASQRRALREELERRFAALPGVQAVSRSMDAPPASELSMCGGVELPDRPGSGDDPAVCHNFVGARFFETLGIPVLAGRDVAPSDVAAAPNVVVISESVARRYFRGTDPVGKQLLVMTARPPAKVQATVVGVVRDVRYTSLRTDAPLLVYRPHAQEPDAAAHTFLLRAASPGVIESLLPLVRGAVRAAEPSLPPPSVVRLEDRVAAALAEERLLAALSTAIGAMAGLLAAIGIYGLVAASVARRRREIGVRMALGAEPAGVARSVVREALTMVAAGLVLGLPLTLAAALAARAALAGMLFDVPVVDPPSLAAAALTMLLIGALAAYAPARRASAIDPMVAMREP